jgi:hypothetical protein
MEIVKEILPSKTYLCETDHRESLNDSHKTILKCVEQNSLDPLFEELDFTESEMDSEDAYKKELKGKLEEEFELVESFMDEHDDEIREAIEERNQSNPMKDLMRHTSKIIFFYETGYEMDSESWSWTEARVRQERIAIKRHLGILGYSASDEAIVAMIQMATYGGSLVVFFREKFEDLIFEGEGKREASHVIFSNPMIAIVNTANGSGSDCPLGGVGNPVSIRMPFKRNNVNVEKCIEYNYTYEVCGMSEDWCDQTGVSFEFGEMEKTDDASIPETKRIQARDEEYDRVFKAGGCSPGDMDIRRHRHAIYVNEYPCGNRCTDCGTFWID